MSMRNFANAYAVTAAFERGYSNNPDDPGGSTQDGVTQKVFTSYLINKGLPDRDVRAITDDEKADIFRTQYWDAVHGDDLPSGLDLAVFDYAVNSGPTRAIKDLQRVLNVTVDGNIGQKTLQAAAVACANNGFRLTITTVCDTRYKFMQSLKNFKTFGRGWKRRVLGDTPQLGIVDYAIKLAETVVDFSGVISGVETTAKATDGPFDSASAGTGYTLALALPEPLGTLAYEYTAARAAESETAALRTGEGRGLACASMGFIAALVPAVRLFKRDKDLNELLYALWHSYAMLMIAVGLCVIAWEYYKRRDEKRM